LAWSIEYTKTAKEQLRKLDKPVAWRILEFDGKARGSADDPRHVGNNCSDLRHRQYREMGAGAIRAWLQEDGVLYDVKHLLPLETVEGRL
jgi:hypothetical protein